MVDDRDSERDKGQRRPSRPVTAAARRERRASARPAANKDATKASGSADGKAKTGKAASDKSSTKKARAKDDTSAKAATRAEHKGRPTPPRDRKETQGLFRRIFRFLREVVAELRKVIWPTRKQMITYTSVVLVFVAFMVALIYGLDLGLTKGVFWLFG